MSKTVRAIQFSICMQFDQQIGPYQVLLLRARVNLGAMVMKEHSAFPKDTALLEPLHQIV